jgi:hypothetical protein
MSKKRLKVVRAVVRWEPASHAELCRSPGENTPLKPGDDSAGWVIDWTFADGTLLKSRNPFFPLFFLRQDTPQAVLVDTVHLSAEDAGYRYGGVQIEVQR